MYFDVMHQVHYCYIDILCFTEMKCGDTLQLLEIVMHNIFYAGFVVNEDFQLLLG